MQQAKQISSPKNNRRKILWGIGIFSFFPLLRFGFGGSNKKNDAKKNIADCAPAQQPETMKFLTQDGQLVEVDVSKIESTKQKISNNELLAWIKK